MFFETQCIFHIHVFCATCTHCTGVPVNSEHFTVNTPTPSHPQTTTDVERHGIGCFVRD